MPGLSVSPCQTPPLVSGPGSIGSRKEWPPKFSARTTAREEKQIELAGGLSSLGELPKV